MGEAAKLCAEMGYDEVQINVGCPSDAVSVHGGFGACLLREAELVQQVLSLP
jgi:tRNA-dihydrouridine synthase A